MNFTLSNYLAYCLQIAVVVAAGIALPFLFRLTAPKPRLAYWHALLLVSLALPMLQPWRMPARGPALSVASRGVPVSPDQFTNASAWSWYSAVVWLLVAGAVIRVIWLGIGILRLDAIRRNGVKPDRLPGEFTAAAEILVSAEVRGPVTFGIRRPVILLHSGFRDLPAEFQRGILLHELLHVKRRDWLVVLLEELVRAAFWFHPAIWWLLGRIQITREQAVDHEVIGRTGKSEEYLDALLVVALGSLRPDLAPAPLFLKKRHLRSRVASIVKGVHMSKRRLIVSSIALFCTMPLVVGLAAWRFPLTAAAQEAVDAPGVQVVQGNWSTLHRTPVPYPDAARVKGISGEITANVTTGATGEVTDVHIASGPEELGRAVLRSVINWHFASGPSTFPVVVRFAAPPTAARLGPDSVPPAHKSVTVESLDLSALPSVLRDRVTSANLIHVGDVLSEQRFQEISQELQTVDSHLRMAGPLHGDAVALRFTLAEDRSAQLVQKSPPRIQVKSEIEEQNLVQRVEPVYPPLARAARVQGTVRLSVNIGKDGHIQAITLITGHPLLVQAAQDAVRQWVYRPMLLNGNPVDVTTEVSVVFAL